MISGEIDLSVGQVYALTAFMFVRAVNEAGVPVLLAVLIALVRLGADRARQRRRDDGGRRVVVHHHARHVLPA